MKHQIQLRIKSYFEFPHLHNSETFTVKMKHFLQTNEVVSSPDVEQDIGLLFEDLSDVTDGHD